MDVLKRLYVAVVRSKVEYCTVGWDGSAKRNLILLEKVQRRVTRHIVGSETEYSERLANLDLLPLSYRREILDLLFFHNCKTGVFVVPFEESVEFTTWRGDEHFLRGRLCRTETYCGSYFNRIVKVWNQLPCETRGEPDHDIFKRKVLNFYRSKLEVFNSENSCTWTSFCRCTRCRPT